MTSQTLRGHYGSALSHVHNSVKILASIDEDKVCLTSRKITISHCVPLATLQLMIAKLDFQSYQVRKYYSLSGYVRPDREEAS